MTSWYMFKKNILKFYTWALPKVAIIVFMVITMAGLHFFWTGFHGLDTAQNLEGIINELDGDPTRFHECDTNLDCYDLHTTYLTSMRWMFIGFATTVGGAFCLGLTLAASWEGIK